MDKKLVIFGVVFAVFMLVWPIYVARVLNVTMNEISFVVLIFISESIGALTFSGLLPSNVEKKKEQANQSAYYGS